MATLTPTRKGLCLLLLLALPAWLSAQEEETPAPVAAPAGEGTEMVELTMRDDTIDQVLTLLETLTGRSVIRPQALPASTFTFTSQRPMTRDEAILAIQTMLSINGVGVTPMGDLFLRVVPLQQIRQQSPEFLTEPASNLPPSGRVVSRFIELEFLAVGEIQAELATLVTQPGGTIIPFPKSNALLITDTVVNLQTIEQLLAEADRPVNRRTETRFYPVRFARATELATQVQTIAAGPGGQEMGAGTSVTADERTNQLILVADARQMEFFERLIQQLDVQADLTTRNEVLYLKHANAVEVASLLSNLVGGARTGTGTGAGGGSSARPGGAQNRGGLQQRQQRQQQQRQQPQQLQRQQQQRPQSGMPPIPGQPRIQAQQAADPAQAVQSAIEDAVATTDFSETLTILPDERTNAIIVSGTRQDLTMIEELIEKIDIILAQVRIEVFIAEVALNENEASGLNSLGINYTEGGLITGNAAGPGYTLRREGIDWAATISTAASRGNVKILSNPTIVTTHNREASIEVGESRPIISGTLTGGQFGGTTQSAISYQTIGIQLHVLPLIGADGTIQLEIDQRVEDIVDTVIIDGNEQPVIGTRQAMSFVSVADRETVILGGLQSQTSRNGRGRLAFLGRVPILGHILNPRNRDNNRTELLVFIRPTVIANTDAAHRDAQQAIEKDPQRDIIREALNPPPPPPRPGLSPEALELRHHGLRRQYEAEFGVPPDEDWPEPVLD